MSICMSSLSNIISIVARSWKRADDEFHYFTKSFLVLLNLDTLMNSASFTLNISSLLKQKTAKKRISCWEFLPLQHLEIWLAQVVWKSREKTQTVTSEFFTACKKRVKIMFLQEYKIHRRNHMLLSVLLLFHWRFRPQTYFCWTQWL